MAGEQILFIDDEQDIRNFMQKILEDENFVLFTVSNGSEGLQLLKEKQIDLVMLDLNLEREDGLEILQQIRRIYPVLPVLIVSAKKELHHKVLGLGLGADDYITKPFESAELIARLKTQIHRMNRIKSLQQDRTTFFIYDCFQLDLKKFEVSKHNQKIKMPSRLIKLLALFMDKPRQVLSKKEIYDHLWDDGYYDGQSVMVYIQKLRQHIEEDPKNPVYIQTIYGEGYMLDKSSEY